MSNLQYAVIIALSLASAVSVFAFSMTLKKVSDSALGVKGVALQLAVTLARGLTGI